MTRRNHATLERGDWQPENEQAKRQAYCSITDRFFWSSPISFHLNNGWTVFRRTQWLRLKWQGASMKLPACLSFRRVERYLELQSLNRYSFLTVVPLDLGREWHEISEMVAISETHGGCLRDILLVPSPKIVRRNFHSWTSYTFGNSL